MPNITVIHHSADYDGIFCREIARKFLPDAELIGWDFPDKALEIPPEGQIYILDLPVDRVFGFDFNKPETLPQPLDRIDWSNFVWIDHHKSSIDSHPSGIPGYRIDGVSACRLAWQWFYRGYGGGKGLEQCYMVNRDGKLPQKQEYNDRTVSEPLAVRLAGEYDVWDHRGDGDLEFQFGLDAWHSLSWDHLLSADTAHAVEIVDAGCHAMRCYAKRDADILRTRSFLAEFEGLKFLVLNTARANSNTFAVRDVPETGHDALMGFYYNGRDWNFSLYHAAHRKDLDLSQIAVKYGGGGHRGACGFRTKSIPFLA